MREDSETGSGGHVMVWTHRTQNTVLAHPVTDRIPTALALKGWVIFDLRRQSGACSVRAGIEYSNDGETWDTAVAFGPAYTTTEGITNDTAFTDLGALGSRKRWARFVILTTNASASAVEYCEAALTVQLTGVD